VPESLEVEQLVDACRVLDVHEELHAEHGVDEHDEEQQQTDVEQRRQRHGQREQHLTSPPDRSVTSTKNLPHIHLLTQVMMQPARTATYGCPWPT